MTATTSTLGQYLPIVLLAGLAFVFAAASLAASALARFIIAAVTVSAMEPHPVRV